jgi:hypothetical protein
VLLLLLACTGAPQSSNDLVEQPVVEASPEQEVRTFDAWPGNPELLPAPSLVAVSLQTHGIQAACAEYASQVSYKTDVSVSTIAAARTGAEIGALIVEAPVTDPAKLAERVQRIQAGLASMNEESLALQETSNLLVFLSHEPEPSQITAHLDLLHAKLLVSMEAQSDNELLPVLFAGAWMQAYLLMAQGLEATNNPGPGHALFNRPHVGEYFSGYVASTGQTTIPSGMLAPLEETLLNLRMVTQKDPMSAKDLATVRQGLDDILGML